MCAASSGSLFATRAMIALGTAAPRPDVTPVTLEISLFQASESPQVFFALYLSP